MGYEAKQLDYARAILAAGRAMGVSRRGIIIGLATGLVETNLWNYANRAVPASLTVPYDRIGSDSKSVGIMQQQPQWWGDGTGLDLMVPATAARLFFAELVKLDYNGAGSPGSYAQAVQRSSYPNRYDERFAEATALYDQITAGSTAGSTTGVPAMVGYGVTQTIPAGTNGRRSRSDNIGLHTQEGGTGDAPAAARYCAGAGVSYNDAVDDVDTVRMVAPENGPWAAVAANDTAYHLLFAGSYVAWSRGRWLSKDASDGLDEDAMLTRGARAVAAACRQFNIPPVWVGNNGATGWPPARGICGHKDFGARGGGHTDPYPNFPVDEFIRRVQAFLNPVSPNLIDAEAKVAAKWIGKRITGADTPQTTDDETPLYRDGKKIGAFARFENGHVYWRNGASLAYAIPGGGLFEAYTARGWETGELGFPLLRHAIVTTPAGKVAGVQSFEGGVLFTPDGGPAAGYVVHGEIGKRYAAMDWEQGPLGLPTSDEVTQDDGTIVQTFEGGKLTYVPTGVLVDLVKG